jgi:hypothetical protein
MSQNPITGVEQIPELMADGIGPRLQVYGVKRAFRFDYDFAKDGGAIGTIQLRGTEKLPSTFVIVTAIADVAVLVAGGGGATIAVQAEAANDIRAAATIATGGFDSTGRKALIPVGTAATTVKTTVPRNPVLVVAVAALTAGRFSVFIEGYVAREA